MKKLIGIVSGDKDLAKAVVDSIVSLGAASSVTDLSEALDSVVSECVPKEVSETVVLNENYIRKFFAKMQRGVFAVTPFQGKAVSSFDEAKSYYDSIATRCYGPEYLSEIYYDKYAYLQKGVYVAYGLKMDDVYNLKEKVRKDFISVLVAGEGMNLEVPKMDYVIDVGSGSKASVKKAVVNFLTKLKEDWKGEK